MNLLNPYTFFLLLALLIIQNCPAQASATEVDSVLTKTFAKDDLLHQLIDSAIKFSPEASRVGYTVDYAKNMAKVSKNAIFNALSLLSSYNYGTNFSAINNQSGMPGNTAFTKAQTGYYSFGVGLQLPISQLITRKSLLRANEALVKANTSEQQKINLLVKQEVIRLYQDLKLSYKLISLSSKNKQGAEVNYSMAEKNFILGQNNTLEISSIQDILNKASMELETYINRFQTNFLQLEAYTGTDLSSLIKQQK